MNRNTIGVALSGGGFRASMWALGSLMNLEDAGKAGDVTMVTSVSGGSITNGVVAAAGDFGTGPRIRESSRRLVEVAADDGLIFFGPATSGYVRTLLISATLMVASVVAWLVLVVFGPFPEGWTGFTLGAALTLACLGVRRVIVKRGSTDVGLTVFTLVGGVFGIALSVVSLTGQVSVSNRFGLVVAGVGSALLLVATVVLLESRSLVAERALAEELYSTESGAIPIASLSGRRIFHVFCATELQSGIHAYMSPRFVHSFRFGHGQPVDLPLARAVQASACLPGAFRPRTLDTTPFGLTRVAAEGEPGAEPGDSMLLVDGGVYDNMAVSWFVGLRSRRDTMRQAGLDFSGWANPGFLFVVNASAGWEWLPLKSRFPLLREFSPLFRVQSVMYKTTTRPRRAHLVREWQLLDRMAREESLRDSVASETRGTIINIDQSPWTLAEKLQGSSLWGARAQAALSRLEDLRARGGPDREGWVGIAALNSREPTVLSALGREGAQRLIFHAYILTAVGGHIFADLPLPSRFPLPDELADPSGRARIVLPEQDWY